MSSPVDISQRATSAVRALVRALSSYALASVLFVLLLLLTYLGTQDQVAHGLLHAQEKYFAALLVFHDAGPFRFPLPGAYLLLVLLFINIVFGALLRIPRGWAQLGMFLAHGGIVVLLLGAFVDFHFAERGEMVLRPGQVVASFTREDKSEHALPFAVRLEKFTRELHPGTDTPREFSSAVVRIEDGREERALIGMNQPMRHAGYIFYQSSWGPQPAPPGAERYSVLAVARNPADRFPLYACVVIALGMTLHFLGKLWRYAADRRA